MVLFIYTHISIIFIFFILPAGFGRDTFDLVIWFIPRKHNLLFGFPLQVSMACSAALSAVPSPSWSCVICSAHVAGGAGFPWQALKLWTQPLSHHPLRRARRTTDRWMRATPPSNGTPSSSCSTRRHRQSWPASSSWEAASRSILWSTGLKTDPLKLWRVWWMYRCWSTKVPSRSSTPFSTRLRRGGKWGFSWPSSSGRKLTGPGWRWGSHPVCVYWAKLPHVPKLPHVLKPALFFVRLLLIVESGL